MTITTQEHLFQYNMEQVLKRIKDDWQQQIRETPLSFEDWLHENPKIVGEYTLEQLTNNFDFETL